MSRKPDSMFAASVSSSDTVTEIVSIRNLRDILFRRRATIFMVTGLVTLLAVAYTMWKGPVYTATASVLIEPTEANLRFTVQSIVDTQRNIISSPALIEATMTDLDLYDVDEYRVDPRSFAKRISDWTATLASRGAEDTTANRISGWTATLASWFADDTTAVSADAKAQEALTRAQSEAIFARSLTVTQVGESLILDVSFSTRDPARAADVANHLADLYLETQLARKRKAAQQAEEWLSARVADMRAQVLDAERKLADYRAQHQFQLDQVAARSASAVVYQELERDAEARRANYATMLARYYASSDNMDSQIPDAHLIAGANTPTEPRSLPVVIVAAVSLVSSFVMGCGVAFVRERTDRRLRTGDQIETVLGIPYLGPVPKPDTMRGPGYGQGLKLTATGQSYLQAMQSLSLRIMAVDPPPRILLVTSPLPDRSRAAIAGDLATAMRRTIAERVLLVDFEVRESGMAAHFGLPADGAGTAVPNETSEAEAPTVLHSASGVDILAADLAADAGDLPSRAKVTGLLNSLRPCYDLIVVNGPALLVAAEAQLLAYSADATILVARSKRTKIDDVEAGLALGRVLGAPVLGVVLSHVKQRKWRSKGA